MSNFFNYNELSQLHIELTNACNAGCPMCTRFHVNSTLIRPDLTIDQITIDKFKKYFPPEIIKKMEIILFCGVHGDPGMAKDLYEICEYIATTNPETAVRMNTNGGMRNPDFWSKLGALFAKQRQDHWRWIITWSIDGLEDTNHLYRRNVVWKKLMANAQAFIDAGGCADWDYLIFKHNEHQIDEAKALARQMGFREFYPKKALGVDNGTNLVRMSAMTREGELDYWIDAPEKPENRNLEKPYSPVVVDNYWTFDVDHYKRLKEKKLTYNNYPERIKTAYEMLKSEDTVVLDQAEIKCKAKTMSGGKEIFVDNFGRVMPCCYIGTHLNGTHSDSHSLQLHYEMNKYGWEPFDLNKYTLKEILEGHHLDRVFTDSWTKPSCKVGKMAYCANICGTFSRVDKIYTHEKMEDKSRNWRFQDQENSNE
jgi:MoaA/NifB/PqqE/SkfB family radical SAM enzyme